MVVIFEPAVIAGQMDLRYLKERSVPFIVLGPGAAATLPQQLLCPCDADTVHNISNALYLRPALLGDVFRVYLTTILENDGTPLLKADHLVRIFREPIEIPSNNPSKALWRLQSSDIYVLWVCIRGTYIVDIY